MHNSENDSYDAIQTTVIPSYKVYTWYCTLQAAEGDTKISIDPSLHHHQRLEEANKGLDDLLGHGSDIIGNLKNQRFTLKVRRAGYVLFVCITQSEVKYSVLILSFLLSVHLSAHAQEILMFPQHLIACMLRIFGTYTYTYM